MADFKTLQTRIALKHDTWANWADDTKEGQGANLVLLKGEIGLCEIPAGNANATNAPTVLFKVGNGEKKFSELNWASALAADVYNWAKASDVVLEGKSIKFVGAKNTDGSDKVVTIPYMTEAEVKALIKPVSDDVATLKSDVADLKAKFGEGDETVDAQLEDIRDRLDIIEGDETVDGSIRQVAFDLDNLSQGIEETIVPLLDMPKADEETGERLTVVEYVESMLASLEDGAVADNAAAIATNASEIARVDGRVTTLSEATEAAFEEFSAGIDEALEHVQSEYRGMIGDLPLDGDGEDATIVTVVELIGAAQDAADAAQADVDALTAKGGAVTVNTANIATNAAAIADNAAAIENLTKTDGVIAGINKDISDEVEARKAADKAITDSIGTVADGKTVVKMIEDAQAAAETAAQGKVDALANGAVATNASEIARVEGKFDDYVEAQAELGHESRIAAMEAFFEGATRDEGEGENLKNALDTLKEIQDFATGEGSAAAEMLEAIDANAKAIKAVEDIVKDGGTLEVRVDAVEAAASANAGAIEALQTLTGGFAEGETVKAKIEAAASLGQTGIDNAATAQAAADEADRKAQAAQGEVDALEGVVSTLRSEYDVTKQAAIDNAADIAAIEAEFGENGRVTALEADSHTHTFVEAELNEIKTGDVAKWNEAYNKRHEHSFVEDELENIAAGDVEKWNTAATTAATAASDLAALTTRVGTAEGEIDALQAIVSGEDGNVALGAEIDALAAIVGDEAKGNEALATELGRVAGLVDNTTTGLAATKAVADEALTKAKDAQSRVAAIEGDYLKEADWFVIDCGTSMLREGEPTA